MNLALSEHLPLIASAPEGIQKLRELILDLAVRGKLVPQDPNDEPANDLLEQIKQKRAQLETGGACKKSKKLPPLSKDEQPFALPHNWTWTRLGEVTNFGYADKNGEISEFTWVLDLEDIQKNTSELLKKVRFSERPAKSDKNRFQPGDVLYGKLRPYLNKIIIADEEGVCTTEILPVRGYLGVHPPYLMHAMKRPDFLAYVNAKSYGMKMPRLGTDDGRLAPFPLAPINEQHRIATKVDELMALCDRLESEQNDSAAAHTQLVETLLGTLSQSTDAADFEANWKRISEHFDALFTTEASIDALQQTIMQLAVMGKLVSQDPSSESAETTIKKMLQERQQLEKAGVYRKSKTLLPVDPQEINYPLPTGWAWARLGQIGDWGAGATPSRSNPKYYGGKVPWFKSGELTADFIEESEEHVTEAALKECSLRQNLEGDILLAMYGATIGKTSILSKPATTNQAVCACTPYSGMFNRYLLLLLKALKPNFIGQGAGGAQPNISREKIIATVFALPPTTEQHRIVAKVDEILALCDNLKNQLAESRKQGGCLADTFIQASLKAA